ncbi:MAG: plastocyanin/azurin family copper-binding protein, partial [Bacteroidota bacterium]
TARSFPQTYWNQAALVCEPTGHLLHWAKLEKEGAGYAEKDGWNLLASSDEWVSPVHAEVGPDGAVWVLDWYNFIIQHNPTPKGFKNGKGNAHVNRNRDYEHGRIYRISYDKGQSSEKPDLSNNNPTSLIAALENDNLLWRMHAQRLLVERGNSDVTDDLLALVASEKMDVLGQNNAAVHALWTLHGLGAFDESRNEKAIAGALQALTHPAAGVRKAALQVLPKTKALREAALAQNLANDPDQHTRLAAILALSEMEDDANVGALLYALSQYEEVQRDNWLAQAVYIASANHRGGFLQALRNDPAQENRVAAQKIDPDKNWYKKDWDDRDWRRMQVPGAWDQEGHEDLYRFDGVMWHRRDLELSAAQAASAKMLHLGPIDEIDSTWINGQWIGSTSGYEAERSYAIPKGLLQAGRNQITVKVTDPSWRGGFYGTPEQLYLQTDNNTITLAGEWKLKVGRIIRSTIPHFVRNNIVDEFLKYYESDTPLPPAAASAARDPNVHYVDLKTVREQMQYDQQTFTVRAGETVEIVFENNDAMQHNLLLIQPGRLEDLGAAADAIATAIDAAEMAYVPPVSYVLHHTELVNPGQTVRLRFTAPDTPGDYPYVCTFPGHWKMMNGVMKVVAEDALSTLD